MNMPGFAAEASLYKTRRWYTAAGAFGRRTGGVHAQLIIPVGPPGLQHVPALACDSVCFNACQEKFFDGCIAKCCWLVEYFPPRY